MNSEITIARPLGNYERYWHFLHQRRGFISVTAMQLDGEALTPSILREALNITQQSTPILQAHISNTNKPSLVFNETSLIPFQVVDRISQDQWIEHTDIELHQPLPINSAPRVRAKLLYSPKSNVSELIFTADHTVVDGEVAIRILHDILTCSQKLIDLQTVTPPNNEFSIAPIEELMPPELVVTAKSSKKKPPRASQIPVQVACSNPKNRRTKIIHRKIDNKKLKAFRLSCRKQKVAPHATICAAAAMASRVFVATPTSVTCASNVSLKKYCRTNGPQLSLSCFASIAPITVPLSNQCSIFDVSRAYRSDLNDFISSKSPISIAFQQFTPLHKFAVGYLLPRLNSGRLGGITVSNLGKTRLKRDYGSFYLNNIILSSSIDFIGAMIELVLGEIEGSLYLTFSYVEPLIDRQSMEKYVDEFTRIIDDSIII